MSINNLFSQNDYNLYCNNLNCNNLIPQSIVSNNAVYRFNVDPTSNPDPLIGGLTVTSAETAGFNFALPLSTNQGSLGLGTPISYDPNNHLTLNGSTITCNKTGNYEMSLQLNILSNVVTPNNICLSQVVNVGENIFSGPPGVTAGSTFVPLNSTPVGAAFNIGSLITGSAIVHLNAGDQIDLKFYVAYDTCVIALTSCLCIQEL